MQNSAFISNTGAFGAGIANSGTLMVTGATFNSNSSGNFEGGGISNSGTAVVENSTFYANVAYVGGGIRNSRVLTITNSSIDANVVSNPNGSGGGVYQSDYSGTATISYRNTIIAGSIGGNDCTVESGAIVENTNNLVADGTCSAAFSGDALLGDLGDYGGDTQTVPLLPGSPAIDAGDGATCLATDQRGVERPEGRCDIGAFESRGFTLAKGTGDGQSTPWGMAFAAPITVSVSSAYTEPVDGGQVTYAGPVSGAGTAPITGTATITGG
ncbi:MAG: hypothetical protein KDE24_03750, partial [Caldilinea sp.]|nr:hypothetical protein [Caldilinea sp.]